MQTQLSIFQKCLAFTRYWKYKYSQISSPKQLYIEWRKSLTTMYQGFCIIFTETWEYGAHRYLWNWPISRSCSRIYCKVYHSLIISYLLVLYCICWSSSVHSMNTMFRNVKIAHPPNNAFWWRSMAFWSQLMKISFANDVTNAC